mmetsp:Transcript_37834/g.106973  ORF Transcript_37834/g.106973 Transcript_37834/m.106973 type:complete len:222 (-) Transcript_37834:466-1131(-)
MGKDTWRGCSFATPPRLSPSSSAAGAPVRTAKDTRWGCFTESSSSALLSPRPSSPSPSSSSSHSHSSSLSPHSSSSSSSSSSMSSSSSIRSSVPPSSVVERWSWLATTSCSAHLLPWRVGPGMLLRSREKAGATTLRCSENAILKAACFCACSRPMSLRPSSSASLLSMARSFSRTARLSSLRCSVSVSRACSSACSCVWKLSALLSSLTTLALLSCNFCS